MNALFNRRRAERFAQLLDEGGRGRRNHARSPHDDELAEFVAVGRQLRTLALTVPASAGPSPTFKRDLRAQLIATAQRDGIGVTAIKPVEQWPMEKPAGRARAQIRARGAIIIGVAAGTLALSGVSVASGEAIPGDALYGVKRSTEKAQLALAGSDLSRGQLYLEFARTRLQEAYAVRQDPRGFPTALAEMDRETRQGVAVLISSAMDRHDTTALDAVDRFAADQRLLVSQILDVAAPNMRGQVTESLALLAAIEQRTNQVRAAIACGVKPTGTDSLGRVPGACAAQTTQQHSQSSNPATETTKSTTGTTPTTGSSPSASTGSTTPTEKKPEDDGLLGELGRILGNLLGS